MPHEVEVVSAHRTPEKMIALRQAGGRSRPQGHHRRRRRRRAPARHARLRHHPAGDRRARAARAPRRARLAAVHRADARRHPRRDRLDRRREERRPARRAHPRDVGCRAQRPRSPTTPPPSTPWSRRRTNGSSPHDESRRKPDPLPGPRLAHGHDPPRVVARRAQLPHPRLRAGARRQPQARPVRAGRDAHALVPGHRRARRLDLLARGASTRCSRRPSRCGSSRRCSRSTRCSGSCSRSTRCGSCGS